MVAFRSLWLLLPRLIRRLPADLAAVIVLVVATNVAALAPLIRETPLRVPLGLVFVLFVPGYAFIAALFPEAGESPVSADEASSSVNSESMTDDADSDGWYASMTTQSGIDGVERVALSFGLSIAIVPLIGLVLNFTPWGIRLVPIIISVSGFTLIATAVAASRRQALPVEERFQVPYREWYAAGRAELLEPDTRADAALNVLLVLSVVLAAGSVGYAVTVPPDGEQFSSIYLLTENDDGELVADDYPTEFVQGESQEVIVGIDNHEQETTEYTVVVLEQDVEVVENETATSEGEANTTVNETIVQDQRELDRFSTTIAHNESWHQPYDLEPTMSGEDQRIVWLLFPGGDVPPEPSMADTEYSVHLWVNVSEE
ncbi:DUF1616 domain-containing protein [Natrinema versiforme]|uniref:DUF1616 domain-containing protein n=1 Tax=Natrinema versiforme JCM 10478 TaxID=1227496 RepID=L9XM42_9EURY|nr:DUF1616 domain-containing protein [Natrinema versiforme]ELY62810.1 hypothetical protein C489_21076 [Natrinema versiforme JCM 10478]